MVAPTHLLQSIRRLEAVANAPRRGSLVDQYGNPITSTRDQNFRRALAHARQELKAKYDAAQTTTHNENHWANADHLDPHQAASSLVRKKLRSRSRYEILENNPFLKGIILTIANDFVGTGPKLQITDERIPEAQRPMIENRWQEWAEIIRFRHKLWRKRIGKIVDGEGIGRFYINQRQPHGYPLKLNLQIKEPECLTTEFVEPAIKAKFNEIDGLRFDDFDNVLQYYLLKHHPGFSFSALSPKAPEGQWLDAEFVLHWFRQDRGWLRGVPETTPSLPLCAILRRYTLAVVRHAETAADFTAIIESEGPPGTNPWTDGAGTQLDDDPFDIFPIEMGMITNLPWGYQMKQLNPVPLGVQYDEFVGALLREITRPLLVPFNISVGSSKDSNMASAVVDREIYRGGQNAERLDCNEVVLDSTFALWWSFASTLPGYFETNPFRGNGNFLLPPKHRWRWDRIGLDHTDPAKVAQALQTLHDKKFLTDRDVQEVYYNRSVEEWRKEVLADDEFRSQLTPDPATTPKEAPEDEEGDE